MTFDILNTPKKNPLLDQLFTVNGTLFMTIFIMVISIAARRLDLLPFLPEAFGLGLHYFVIGLPLLIGISVYRSYWYRKQTAGKIGTLDLEPSQVTIAENGAEEVFRMDNIARLDVRFAYGGESPFRNNENIHRFRIVRLSGFFGGEKKEFIISNLDQMGNPGALTAHLESIRKTSLDLHRKIQLWERYE